MRVAQSGSWSETHWSGTEREREKATSAHNTTKYMRSYVLDALGRFDTWVNWAERRAGLSPDLAGCYFDVLISLMRHGGCRSLAKALSTAADTEGSSRDKVTGPADDRNV